MLRRHVVSAADRVPVGSSNSGIIADQPLAELQGVDVGSAFTSRYAGEHVLSLEDCLASLEGASRGLAFASGMAAEDAVLRALVTVVDAVSAAPGALAAVEPIVAPLAARLLTASDDLKSMAPARVAMVSAANGAAVFWFIAAGAVRCPEHASTPAELARMAELARLPGIGPRSAQRLAFHLLKSPPERSTAAVKSASPLLSEGSNKLPVRIKALPLTSGNS